MRIVVSGATGFIGTAVCRRLASAGHALTALARDVGSARVVLPHGMDVLPWDTEDAWHPAVDAADAVINLAGAPIAAQRWTAGYKQTLRHSRVDVTRRLVAAMTSGGSAAGRVLLNGSAVGYYGDTGDAAVTEQTPAGSDFLGQLCLEWEAATAPATRAGARVVLLRTGIVLGPGGALERMLAPFRLGLGGPLGSGRQWVPWVHLVDAVEMIAWALESPEVYGPVNVVSPNPVTMRQFATSLGRALRRAALLPVPAFALRAALGELADALLGGQRAAPAVAAQLGFRWRFPALDDALADILGVPAMA